MYPCVKLWPLEILSKSWNFCCVVFYFISLMIELPNSLKWWMESYFWRKESSYYIYLIVLPITYWFNNQCITCWLNYIIILLQTNHHLHSRHKPLNVTGNTYISWESWHHFRHPASAVTHSHTHTRSIR